MSHTSHVVTSVTTLRERPELAIFATLAIIVFKFFKAVLFLGAGSVIIALHHEQDMRKMGGLKAHMPLTYVTFFISVLAIAGFPPFAGFFSKDEILWLAYTNSHVSKFVWLLALVVVSGLVLNFVPDPATMLDEAAAAIAHAETLIDTAAPERTLTSSGWSAASVS